MMLTLLRRLEDIKFIIEEDGPKYPEDCLWEIHKRVEAIIKSLQEIENNEVRTKIIGKSGTPGESSKN
jgi:hypothetical protein